LGFETNMWTLRTLREESKSPRTNINTSTNPDSISKPRFEIDNSNAIPILINETNQFRLSVVKMSRFTVAA